MDEITNIWNADDELNDEQLMNYIKNKATDKDAHTVEQQMANSSFTNDGVDGLQQFSSAEKINIYKQQLNEKLHQQLSDKKQKRRYSLKSLSWEIIAVIVIMILAVLGYVVIEMMRQ